MATDKENIVILEKIYSRTLKARDAYQNASKNVHNRLLTDFFGKAAEKHENFASALKKEISNMGTEIKDKSAFNPNADQFWLDFASIIVQRNESAMLKNCLRAEKKAIELYNEALEHNNVPDSFKERLITQRDYALRLAEEIDSLEKQYGSD